MPWVFVLIWSTGFIVARFGMPHAPPLELPRRALRALGALLRRLDRARACRVAARPRAMAAPGRHRRADACGLPRRRLGRREGRHRRRHGGAAGRPAAGADGAVAERRARGGAPARVSARQWLGLALGLAGSRSSSGTSSAAAKCTHWNLALAIFALLGITIGTLYQKRFVAPCDVRTASLIQMSAALVVSPAVRAARDRAVVWHAADDRRDGLVGARADARRQLAALPADPARRGDAGDEPLVPRCRLAPR